MEFCACLLRAAQYSGMVVNFCQEVLIDSMLLSPSLSSVQAAKAMGIDVRGVSFHVGSGATNPAAFSEAIALARAAFDAGAKLGFTMDVLDIGGGFCAGAFLPDGSVNMGGVPSAVNEALAKHFPEPSAVRIIAEPGRYESSIFG